jgi:serine/threonine protein kinase
MINSKGEAVLADFGISAIVSQDEQTKGTVGSARYYAPEIVLTGKKEINGRQTDVWALGVSLFYLVTKKFPFTANTIFGL